MTTVADTKKLIHALTSLGIYVFPVLVSDNPDNPWRKNKRPAIPEAHPKGDPLHRHCSGECGKLGHGFYDATLDAYAAEDMFERYPNAYVGVYMGKSGLVAADFDVKRSPDGTVEVDGFSEFEAKWLELPETYSYPSVSQAGGIQYIYSAPEGINLGPAGGYRGIPGVDRRGGGSYSVWVGEIPTSRNVFSPAPQWLLDPATVRTTERFEGTVRDWIEGLEPGEPSLIVRTAMDRTRELFELAGHDFDHAAMVERQFLAIRLGSERHPGVTQLLDLTEELFLSRTASHSRPPEEWDFEWSESLSSGIQRYGATIELASSLPEYSFNVVPTGVPEQLVLGEAGDKSDFRNLLASLIAHSEDDYLVTTVLWNAPRTRDISREWGLEFVYERVTSARNKPEPVRENPAIPEVTVDSKPVKAGATFLTAAEEKRVKSRTTFIDRYLAASATKGFVNPAYDVPAAWTALSMALGRRAFIPLGKNIGVNIWHIVLGESSTGKSSADAVLKTVLDILMSGNEVGYSLGAKSSPAALSEALLLRDGLPSIVHHDEAADFFRNISEPGNWMADVPDLQAKWYEGWVDPENKVRLSKELKGKSARTSFNKHMLGTPDRVIRHLSADQFESGYLARVNWTWNQTKGNISDKYNIGTQENGDDSEIPMAYVNLAGDLASLRGTYPVPVKMVFSDAAQARLRKAYQDFDEASKDHPRYENFSPSVTRLGSETIWKCAALLALYRGDAEVELDDVLTSIYYASEWLRTLHLIASEVSESMYSRDLEEIESFIREEGGSVSRAKLLHQFRGKVVRSGRELEDRVSFLLESGRVNREQTGDKDVLYRLNGG